MTALENLKQKCLSLNLRHVDGRGNQSAPVWLLGEAPGADEDTQGFPFVGASGRLLDKMCGEVGLAPEHTWLTNPFTVRPPNNELSRLSELGIPLEDYITAFMERINAAKPTIIAALGNTPMWLLCPETKPRKAGEASITKWRGSLLRSPFLKWPHYVVPCQHPAFVLREWSERPIAVFILKRVKDELDYWLRHGTLQPLPERELIIAHSDDEAIQFMLQDCEKADALVSDVETWQKFVTIVGIATSPQRAISFKLSDRNSDPAKTAMKWRIIDSLYRRKKIVNQNLFGFDAPRLEAIGFRFNIADAEDTMVPHHILWPEFPHDLAFLVMQYTRQPFYKDEGRHWTPKDGLDKYMIYNATDNAATYEVWLEERKELIERGATIY